MSVEGENLEAMVWLETVFPDIPAQQRAEFFTAVDAYYDEHPVAERLSGPLGSIRQDGRAFSEILRSIIGGDPPSPTSPSAT